MDKIYRFLIDDANVRGEWVQLEETWKALKACADYPAPVQQMLGESLAAVSLLAATIKYKGTLVFQISGGHPISMLVVQASSDGKLRGMARWKDDFTKDESINGLFGPDARIVITVEPEEGKGERYQSIVNLDGDTLSGCLEAYFEQSEQLKTRLELAVGETSLSGLLVQRLPGSVDDEDGWNRVQILTETVTTDELLTLDVETMLHRLFHEETLRLFDGEPLRFECSCSQQKVDNMLLGLGREEAEETLKAQGKIEVDCDFCNAHYVVDEIDLERIFSEGLIAGNDSVH